MTSSSSNRSKGSPRAPASPSAACRSARSLDRPGAEQPAIHPRPDRGERRARRSSRAPPRRSAASASPAFRRSSSIRPRRSRASAGLDPGNRLPRAESAVRMPLWLSGHSDAGGRLRGPAQHRAGIARARLDPDRAAHRLAHRPQPGIDRRHPRQSRGGQPQPRRALAGNRRDFGRGAGLDPPGGGRRRSDRPARRKHRDDARSRRPAFGRGFAHHLALRRSHASRNCRARSATRGRACALSRRRPCPRSAN